MVLIVECNLFAARPSGKFRPKAKPKPKPKPSKESSASVQSTQCTQPIIVSEHESKNASENTVDGIVVVPPLDENRSSKSTKLSIECLADKEHDGSASGSHSEAILSGISGDYSSPLENVEGEASVFLLINIYPSSLSLLHLIILYLLYRKAI